MSERVVTVLVPAVGRPEMLEAVLPSYLQPPVAEVIVLDDASEVSLDGVVGRLAARDSRLSIARVDTPLGLPATRNRGLEAVTTRFAFFGEDDVELAPGTIAALLDAQERTGAAVVGMPLAVVAFDRREDAARWEAAPAPLPSLGMGREPRIDLGDGLCDVLHVHSVCLVDMSQIDGTRYDAEYGGNAYREESDFQLRLREQGLSVVADTNIHFIHYSRPAHLRRTGCSEMSWLEYDRFALANNRRFLVAHEDTLRATGVLASSAATAQWMFVITRMRVRVIQLLRRAKHLLTGGRR